MPDRVNTACTFQVVFIYQEEIYIFKLTCYVKNQQQELQQFLSSFYND